MRYTNRRLPLPRILDKFWCVDQNEDHWQNQINSSLIDDVPSTMHDTWYIHQSAWLAAGRSAFQARRSTASIHVRRFQSGLLSGHGTEARFPLSELTARVDGWPVSIIPVNTGCVDGRAFPLAEFPRAAIMQCEPNFRSRFLEMTYTAEGCYRLVLSGHTVQTGLINYSSASDKPEPADSKNSLLAGHAESRYSLFVRLECMWSMTLQHSEEPRRPVTCLTTVSIVAKHWSVCWQHCWRGPKGRFPLPEFTGRVLCPWTRVVETDLNPPKQFHDHHIQLNQTTNTVKNINSLARS